MKLRIALMIALAGACGGKKSSTMADAPPSECARTATHTTKLMQSEMGEVLAEADWPKVTALLDERCTKDGWSAESMACMNAALADREIDACADQLPADQNAAVKAQFEQDIVPLMKGGMVKRKDETMQGDPEGAPPPPDDPCGGDD
jgi:hypothetical protein